MVFFSFAHWRFVFSKIRHTVHGMFFMCFWVILLCSVFVQKNLQTFFLKPRFFSSPGYYTRQCCCHFRQVTDTFANTVFVAMLSVLLFIGTAHVLCRSVQPLAVRPSHCPSVCPISLPHAATAGLLLWAQEIWIDCCMAGCQQQPRCNGYMQCHVVSQGTWLNTDLLNSAFMPRTTVLFLSD